METANVNEPGAHKPRAKAGIPGITDDATIKAMAAGTFKHTGSIPGIDPKIDLTKMKLAKPDYLVISSLGMSQQQFMMMDKNKSYTLTMADGSTASGFPVVEISPDAKNPPKNFLVQTDGSREKIGSLQFVKSADETAAPKAISKPAAKIAAAPAAAKAEDKTPAPAENSHTHKPATEAAHKPVHKKTSHKK